MNKREFAIFAAALKTYYPRETLLPNDQAMALWFRQLEDIPFNVAEASLNKWVATNKWSPSIADLRELATGIQFGELPDWGEAWQSVQRSIQRYGYYNQREALDSLDDLTRRCVERLGFKNLCMSEKPETDRANFRMIYEQLANRQKMDAQIPASVKVLIEGIKQDQKLLEG